MDMKTKVLFMMLVLVSLAAGCGHGAGLPPATPLPTAVAAPTRQPAIPTATALPAQILAPANPTLVSPPTATVTAVTPSPSPSPTPYPLEPYTLASLRQRPYPGGPIQVRAVLAQTADFSQSYVAYTSDGLTITGMMHTPAGPGPFPVVILLHGYFDRDRYWSGAGTWQAAEFFARHGFLTLAPDLRSWGESDSGLSLFHTGLAIDVLNLLSAVEGLPQADASRIMLWGHSMGGGIATKLLTIDERLRAAVLYAPNSADDADLIARWGRGCLPGESEAAGDQCNPAEIIPPDTPADLIASYLTAAADPDLIRLFAPIYHLGHVQAPVHIHIGLADGQGLAETPPEWSEKLHAALLAAGKESELFRYAGQGHFFTGESWNLLLQRALILFQSVE
jgi:uncharacterized protein